MALSQYFKLYSDLHCINPKGNRRLEPRKASTPRVQHIASLFLREFDVGFWPSAATCSSAKRAYVIDAKLLIPFPKPQHKYAHWTSSAGRLLHPETVQQSLAPTSCFNLGYHTLLLPFIPSGVVQTSRMSQLSIGPLPLSQLE